MKKEKTWKLVNINDKQSIRNDDSLVYSQMTTFAFVSSSSSFSLCPSLSLSLVRAIWPSRAIRNEYHKCKEGDERIAIILFRRVWIYISTSLRLLLFFLLSIMLIFNITNKNKSIWRGNCHLMRMDDIHTIVWSKVRSINWA